MRQIAVWILPRIPNHMRSLLILLLLDLIQASLIRKLAYESLFWMQRRSCIPAGPAGKQGGFRQCEQSFLPAPGGHHARVEPVDSCCEVGVGNPMLTP